jgi:single-stranded-DNA-specific exonuclease|tara:strand:+ start:21 stop:1739 length:1719 start_codon:yes stop_codon:yes gene_type:complete
MRWEITQTDESCAQHLSQRLGITPTAASLLWQRGWQTPEDAERFLKPQLRRLGDPLAVENLPAAVDRILQAMHKDESILVFGDYDVDGVTATTLIVSILQRFGVRPKFVVPLRQEEGYGLSIAALERALKREKPDLVIAVDCGTSSRDEVAWLTEQGIGVVIIDHHTAKESLPENATLVNPHVHGNEDDEWVDLCAVGLVFKVVHGLIKVLREEGDAIAKEIDLRDYLDLVAMGTISDLVPLHGENRILAHNGLISLKNPRRIGLQALYEVAGMQLGEEVDPFDISFRLGPRINASGRLYDAARPIEMLLGSDMATCRQTAQELDRFNKERKTVEAAIAEEAKKIAEAEQADAAGIVVYNPEWHTGVVGIVASRLVQRFHRPAIVFGSDGNGTAKGSGRSIKGIDLVEVLQRCETHLTKWGGHPMAIGVSAEANSIDAFREAFKASILESVSGEMPDKTLQIDLEIEPAELSDHLLKELSQLAPFGQGNREPVFALTDVKANDVRPFGGDKHLRFMINRPGLAPISGIAWNSAEKPLPSGTSVDIAVRFHWNNWKGRRTPSLTLVDWKPSEN